MARDKIGPNGVVYSFEPDYQNFTKLYKNIKLNNFQNVILYNCALNDVDGKVSLEFSDVSSRISKTLHSESRIVNSFKLDSILSTLDIYDIMKIDTEGNELNILKGAVNLISKSCLPIIILEVNGRHEDFNISEGEIKSFLVENGYLFGSYNHHLNLLKLDNQLHEDTIAILEEFIPFFKRDFQNISLERS